MSTLFVNNLTSASGSSITLGSGKTLDTSAGTLTPSAGQIVQQVTKSDNYSYQEISSTSFVEVTDMNGTITPKFANSKIKVEMQTTFWLTTDANNYFIATLYRDVAGGGYSNLSSNGSINSIQWFCPGRNAGFNTMSYLNYIDTAASTGVHTYKMYGRAYNSTNNVRIKYVQCESTIILTELKV